MKTIEEKARAYDEAIRKLRGMMPNWERLSYNGKTFLQDLIYIIPELAESEDEKIRKEIINYFKCQTRDEPSRKDTHNKWIDWLERKEGCEGFQETGKCFADGECKAKREAEQKPAWSEEEECYICQLESMVKERWALAEKAQDEDVIKNMSNLAFFLKTLNPNKKPADEDMKTLLRTEYEKGRADAIAEMQKDWSEEDEEKFRDVIRLIEQGAPVQSMRDHYTNWLKSLKERYTWRPSKREKEALLWCVVHLGGADKQTLGELLEALNKL